MAVKSNREYIGFKLFAGYRDFVSWGGVCVGFARVLVSGVWRNGFGDSGKGSCE